MERLNELTSVENWWMIVNTELSPSRSHTLEFLCDRYPKSDVQVLGVKETNLDIVLFRLSWGFY